MKKMGLLVNKNKMGEYEIEKGFASYRTVIDYFVGDIVLCNNIIDIDESIYDNINSNGFYYVDDNGEYRTEEEYNNDENGEIRQELEEIYQYYLCNISDYEKEQLEKMGVILSYSDLLECDVLCVDHFGTSWDYVLTNVKLFDNYEELKAYEGGEDNE